MDAKKTSKFTLPFLFPGITKLRFKPAYNPYTEPSMEVFSYHEGIVGLPPAMFEWLFVVLNPFKAQFQPTKTCLLFF